MTRWTPVVAVHGGAGDYSEGRLGAARVARRLAAVETAVNAARDLLLAGAPALDAVCAAVCLLEDDADFNAGRGAARTAAGTVELDAAVMDGHTRQAGSVAAATRVRNPVLAARQVLADGRHVMLAGPGADAFAAAAGLALEDPAYFLSATSPPTTGTVGAVALDGAGRLAAATSTGGIEGQLPGRVGDSPIIGAGTWADGRVAVSATGHGEALWRVVFAHAVAAAVARAVPVAAACRAVLADARSLGGSGGCVAITAAGAIATPFTSAGMFHGVAVGGYPAQVAVGQPLV